MKKVLFVDDNEKILSLYSRFVEMAGYMARTACNIDECSYEINRGIPDLVFLDIMMKPDDGWKTLLKIREEYSSSRLPVIMLTAKIPLLSEVIKYGDKINGYLMKPLTHGMLVEKIDDFFRISGEIEDGCEKLKSKSVPDEIIDEYRTACLRNLFHSDVFSIFDEKKLLGFSAESSMGGDAEMADIKTLKEASAGINSRIEEIRRMMQ